MQLPDLKPVGCSRWSMKLPVGVYSGGNSVFQCKHKCKCFIDLREIIIVGQRYESAKYEEYLPAQHAEVVNSVGQRSCRRGWRLFIVPVLPENHLHVIESMVGDGDVEVLGKRQSAGAAELSFRGDGAEDRGRRELDSADPAAVFDGKHFNAVAVAVDDQRTAVFVHNNARGAPTGFRFEVFVDGE